MKYKQLIPVTDRKRGIGGTDAKKIAAGEWHQLYLEKTGQTPPFDSTYIWIMRLGQETEALHSWWHGHSESVTVTNPFANDPVRNPNLPEHHIATFDRFVEVGDRDFPLEMKHRHARTYLREQATEYMAQLQWQMHVGDYDALRFSLIAGNAEPEWGLVERDQDYIDKLVEQVEAFWWHVTELVAPDPDEPKGKDARAALASAGKTIPLNGFKPYDMSKDNEWCAAAGDYIRDKIAAESLKTTEPKLRGMIPKDAETIAGGGLSFKRDARGAYRVTIEEAESDAWRARLAALIN